MLLRMDLLLYLLAKPIVVFLQMLPLGVVARLGRLAGIVGYGVDARHRRIAFSNLQSCFGGDKSSPEIRRLVRENFRRIGESYASGIKTAAMTPQHIRQILDIEGLEKVYQPASKVPFTNGVFAIGHFGNFELYARTNQFGPAGVQFVTTYRGLPFRRLNRLLLSIRTQSGCRFFERRTEVGQLKAVMKQPGVVLGLLADQHPGSRGLRLPFLGRECFVSAAPAVFARHYRYPLHTAICFRLQPGRWKIEISDAIPTRDNGAARPLEDIVNDMTRLFEEAIRRDPANWFWVHNRWKADQSGTMGQTTERGAQALRAATSAIVPSAPVRRSR